MQEIKVVICHVHYKVINNAANSLPFHHRPRPLLLGLPPRGHALVFELLSVRPDRAYCAPAGAASFKRLPRPLPSCALDLPDFPDLPADLLLFVVRPPYLLLSDLDFPRDLPSGLPPALPDLPRESPLRPPFAPLPGFDCPSNSS